jgi:hypothetical protein
MGFLFIFQVVIIIGKTRNQLMHFLLTFQEVMPISEACNQLTVIRSTRITVWFVNN